MESPKRLQAIVVTFARDLVLLLAIAMYALLRVSLDAFLSVVQSLLQLLTKLCDHSHHSAELGMWCVCACLCFVPLHSCCCLLYCCVLALAVAGDVGLGTLGIAV